MLFCVHSSSRIYSRYGPRYTAVLSGGAAVSGCLPMWLMINSDPSSTIVLGVASFSAGALSAITGPIVKSTLQVQEILCNKMFYYQLHVLTTSSLML
jgi:hypothetical protein